MTTEVLYDYVNAEVGETSIEEWDVCPDDWCRHPSDHDEPLVYSITRINGQVLWEADNKKLIQVGERYFFTWYEDRGKRTPVMGTEELIVEDGRPVIPEGFGKLLLWEYGAEALHRLAQVALVLDFDPDEPSSVEELQRDIEKLQQVAEEIQRTAEPAWDQSRQVKRADDD